MVTLWKQISRRTIHLIPGKQIQVPPVFQQDLQGVVTDWRAWQLFQCCCLLQEPHIFTLVWNNHVLMKPRICTTKLTLQVPPPFAAAQTPTLHCLILFLSSQS